MTLALRLNPLKTTQVATDVLHGREAEARENLLAFETRLPGQSAKRLKASEPSRNAAYWAERERIYACLRKAGLAAD